MVVAGSAKIAFFSIFSHQLLKKMVKLQGSDRQKRKMTKMNTIQRNKNRRSICCKKGCSLPLLITFKAKIS